MITGWAGHFSPASMKGGDMYVVVPYYLSQGYNASVVIDMLNNSNKTVAGNPSLALDGMFTQNMERLTRTYLKLCDALCLSPQSRAKMGALIANKKKEETDPLMNVLKGEANE